MNITSGDECYPSISTENLTNWIVKHLTSSTAKEELLQILPRVSTMQEERRESHKRKFEAVIKSEIEDDFEESAPAECNENSSDNYLQEEKEDQSKCRCKEILGVLEKQEDYFKKMFSQLIDEVTSLRKEVLSLNRWKHSYESSSLPTSSFETVEEFIGFEKSLQEDEDKFADLKHELVRMNVTDPEKFVKHAFKSVFDDRVAQQFCWRGTPEKQSVRDLKFTAAVKCAFQEKFQHIDEEIFLQATMKHFQYAKDRLQKKVKYSASRAPVVTANSPS